MRAWDGPLFSQNLSLRYERLVEPDEDKLKKLAVTLPLFRRDLRQASFTGSDLRRADLSFAQLTGADLNSANLRGANLSNANLSNVRNLTQEQLDEACGTDTKLPPDLTLKPCRPQAGR